MNPMLALAIILSGTAIVSYLLGSISFAVVFTKLFSHVDVRDFGSKNAGMTNVSRVAGKKAAALTLLCDIAKGAASVLLARFVGVRLLEAMSGGYFENSVDPLFFACFAGLFCVLGHIYPLYFGFRGGKGIASFFGVLLFVDWRVALVILLVFLIVLAFTRIVSVSSLSAALSLPFAMFFLYDGMAEYTAVFLGINQHIWITAFTALYTAIAFFTHRSNIKRIIHGEEKKIGAKKQAK